MSMSAQCNEPNVALLSKQVPKKWGAEAPHSINVLLGQNLALTAKIIQHDILTLNA
jgi:hypothetical protein